MKIVEGIKKVIRQESLTEIEMNDCVNQIIRGEATSSQIGSFLTGITIKGEDTEEVVGCVKALRNEMDSVDYESEFLIDVCGTGGDGFNTFNVSTAVSFVIAALGGKVAKHGNRSISSKCGSFDVIEELGIDISMSKENINECLEKYNLAFLFAPRFHKAMKNVASERKEIGIRTLFNQVGPLINPVNLRYQLMGVSRKESQKVACEVMRSIGLKRGVVVCAENGLDEVSISCNTNICELKNGEILEYTIAPEDFGIQKSKIEDIAGGDKVQNASLIKAVLNGEKGAKRDVVVLNSAVAIYVLGICENIKEGIKIAEKCIDDGRAYRKLEELVEFSKNIV